MILDLVKKLFAPKAVDFLWEAMEKTDPLLSFKRFQRLKPTKQQRPLVKGLIDGTVKPAELAAVREWAKQHGEPDDGIHALVFAVQHVLEGAEVTYLFECQSPAPTARFPSFVDDRTLTVLFNDRENHLQITSLDEFVSANDIGDYVLEKLSLSELRVRMTSRAHRYRGIPASAATDDSSLEKGQRLSVTIERNANAQEQLYDAVGAAEIASALKAEGVNVTPADISLESPLEKLGLYKVLVQLEPDTSLRVFVWIVPALEQGENES